MTNGEKFKTAKEREIGFRHFCSSTNCAACVMKDCREMVGCCFAWLELEAKEALKVCPFCGSEYVNTYKSNNTDIWYVACGKCGVRTEGYISKKMAIVAWDRRAK